MKIQLYLRLNWPSGFKLPEELKCPPEISVALEHLQFDEYRGTADVDTLVTREAADRIVEWGSQTIGGISILRNVRYDESYELDDLHDNEIVEVYPGANLKPKTEFGAEDITNCRNAIKMSWACEYCDRVNVSQVADYKVKLHKKLDLQHTFSSEWIVSERLYDLFLQHGCQLRPTQNVGYSQLIVDQRVMIDTNEAPLQQWPTACPSCGLRTIFRSDYIGGGDPTAILSKPGSSPYINKDMSLTVVGVNPSQVGFAKGHPDLPTVTFSEKPIHKIGSTSTFNALYWSYSSTRNAVYFANSSLVRSLYEMGATGMMFRPVKTAKGFASPNNVDK